MSDFKPVEGRIVLRASGVYKSADLFMHNDAVFAKYGSGFIMLKSNKETSKKGVFWADMEIDLPVKEHIGKIVVDHDAVAMTKAPKMMAVS